MQTVSQIIEQWPSAETFADDIGLKHRSHARVMKLRGSIPRRYWLLVIDAAAKRGIRLDEASLSASHAHKSAQ